MPSFSTRHILHDKIILVDIFAPHFSTFEASTSQVGDDAFLPTILRALTEVTEIFARREKKYTYNDVVQLPLDRHAELARRMMCGKPIISHRLASGMMTSFFFSG